MPFIAIDAPRECIRDAPAISKDDLLMDVLKPAIVDIDGRRYRKPATLSSSGNSDRMAASVPCDAEDAFPGKMFVCLFVCFALCCPRNLQLINRVGSIMFRIGMGKLPYRLHIHILRTWVIIVGRKCSGSHDLCFCCISDNCDGETLQLEQGVEQVAQGYRLRMDVPSVLYKYLIGKQGRTRRHMEEDTGCQIRIPRQGEEGPIGKCC